MIARHPRMRHWLEGLPVPTRLTLTPVSVYVERLRPKARFGSFMRAEPIHRDYGASIGTPIDRVYMERFVRENLSAIHGRVLEMERPEWSRLAPHDAVRSLEILDVRPENAAASLVGDLHDPQLLPTEGFDCLLVMQTLQYVKKPETVLSNLWSSLSPGGTLLLSVPTISRLDLMCTEGGDRWRFTPAGLESVIQSAIGDVAPVVHGFGCLATAIGFLAGVPAERLPRKALLWESGLLPLVSCARVDKPR